LTAGQRWRILNDAVCDSLDLAGVLFKNEEVVVADESHAIGCEAVDTVLTTDLDRSSPPTEGEFDGLKTDRVVCHIGSFSEPATLVRQRPGGLRHDHDVDNCKDIPGKRRLQ
jgi:hypothetical protein